MAQTYFRVQAGDRNIRDLLDPAGQVSRAWHRDDRDKFGVSVCASRQDLARYLATAGAGIPFGAKGWVLVELAGDIAADQPLDFQDGELLIHPTAILAAAEIDDDFFGLVGDLYESETLANGRW